MKVCIWSRSGLLFKLVFVELSLRAWRATVEDFWDNL